MYNLKEELRFLVKRNQLIKELETMAERKGFIKVESDFFEEYLSYSTINYSQDLQKFVKVQDNKGSVFLLKPDITTNIIKQVIPKVSGGEQLDLFYSDSVFQFEEDGTIQSIRKFGVEVIGRKDITSDIKLIQFIAEIFTKYNLDYFLEIGNQKFLSTIFKDLKLSLEEIIELKKILTAKNIHELTMFFNNNLEDGYFELLSNIVQNQNDLNRYEDIIVSKNLNRILIAEISRLKEIKEQLPDVNLFIDLTLINEFDYYNGPIYKGYIKQYKKEVLSGGRYDTLTKEYGKETPALGFTLDLGLVIEKVIL